MISIEDAVKKISILNYSKFFNKFQKYYSQGSIDTVAMDDIPECAMEIFEGYSRRFIIPEDYVPRRFDLSLIINHDIGDFSYVVSQPKTYSATSKETEYLMYLVDVNTDGLCTGKIEIRYNLISPSSYFKNKPFVGYHETFLNQRQGFGARRLRVSNALSMTLYDFPLNSDTMLNFYSKSLWEKLERNGEAVKGKERSHDRFRFKV